EGPSDAGPRARCPVVGRDAELEHLDRRLERALAGQRQIIFVTGDPGIGKTTLVEAFLERVAPGVTSGSPEASVSTRTRPERRSCRSWRAWSVSVAGRWAVTSWRSSASMLRPGCSSSRA